MRWRPGGSDLVLFDVSSASDIPFDATGVSFISLRTIVCPCLRPLPFARVHPNSSMADNHKSPLRPEGEDLLQVSYIRHPMHPISHIFSSVPRLPSPTHSPSPTSPALLLSSPPTPQRHPFLQSQRLQGHRMKCSLPQRRQRHRPSPPSRPRSSTPGRRSTHHKSPNGGDRVRLCVRAPR